MTIAIGAHFPALTIKTNGEDGPENLALGDFLAGRRVVIFAVPGAFTPGCSNHHMPGFVKQASALKAAGVDAIACLAVNDAFVLNAWQKDQSADEIIMLADGNAELTRALGLDMDASAGGMGTRSKRFAMIIDDGVVSYLGIDTQRGVIEDSSAEKVLKQLTR
ncbi:peroxiredoxin [Halomonas halocynthiae]|uniref:peroxiredoxin n=1 Tax=Halomonas halocynthiae TaxID=176290 RepID=UPI00041EE553|nr:peroxiredoxin [Halomonas halocynthiae]